MNPTHFFHDCKSMQEKEIRDSTKRIRFPKMSVKFGRISARTSLLIRDKP